LWKYAGAAAAAVVPGGVLRIHKLSVLAEHLGVTQDPFMLPRPFYPAKLWWLELAVPAERTPEVTGEAAGIPHLAL
jgi:hypothetical protein